MAIKYIYTGGTSFTAGGGYEEGSVRRPLQQKYLPYRIPDTMYECSWPGFLNSFLKRKIPVYNFAVPGAGVENMIRLAKDWIENNPHKAKDTLFLLEVSGYGRNEYWSRRLNRHVIVNWNIGQEKPGTAAHLHTGTYWKDSPETHKVTVMLEPLMEAWMTEFIDVIPELFKMHRMLFDFLCFLKYKGYEFKIFGEVFVDPYYAEDTLVKDNFLDLVVNGEKMESMYLFIEKAGVRISQLTQGETDDFHATLEGNKMIAEQYYNQLIRTYDI